jgi:hypothetical protein
MKKTMIAFGFALVSTSALAAGYMKAGLWEMRTLKQVHDGQDMTARMAAAQSEMQKRMASLPPAQRKQMEALMAKQGGGGGGAGDSTMKICVSPQMAERDRPVFPPESKCEIIRFDRSGDRVSFEVSCNPEGRIMTGKGESTVSANLIKSRMDMIMTDARGKHTIQAESEMRYLGSDCQGLKPADQIAHETRQAVQGSQRGK